MTSSPVYLLPTRLLLLAAALFCSNAHAHTAASGPDGGEAADPLGLALLALAAWLYWRGSRRLASRRATRRRTMLFAGGWAALLAAFGPPLEALTATSFAAHMIQHEILMLVAAPLLVLSRPIGVLLWGMPQALRRACAAAGRRPALRRALAVASAPLGAWLLHLFALWAWHVPAAFEAALRHDGVHWLQHLTFFLAAVFFWHSVLAAGRGGAQRGAAVLSIFASALHTGLLGALLTFSSRPWYPGYAGGSGGLTALEDQQLGGLIMWVPGGLVFVAAGLAIAALGLAATPVAPSRRPG